MVRKILAIRKPSNARWDKNVLAVKKNMKCKVRNGWKNFGYKKAIKYKVRNGWKNFGYKKAIKYKVRNGQKATDFNL